MSLLLVVGVAHYLTLLVKAPQQEALEEEALLVHGAQLVEEEEDRLFK